MSLSIALLTVFSSLVAQVTAESHTITFTNNCGHGTPKLIQGSNILSTGDPYTSNGALSSVITYLDNGSCGFNGESCSMVEFTLGNGGNGASSGDITLISPHAFSDAIGFQYTGSCTQGAFCNEASCNTAFHVSTDTCVQVQCESNDAGINVIFCGGSTHFTDASQKGAPCGS